MDAAMQAANEREARIVARRKRIQDRIASLRQGQAADKRAADSKEELGKGLQQIIDSKHRLLRIKTKTGNDVSSVRVAEDEVESQHRIQEESIRQDLRAKLLTEAEQSARQNAAIAMRWADLFAIEVPQDLYDEIERQRVACERIIASKDALIAEIKGELKHKDDEYVKVLKRQAEDIDALLQYMSGQFVEMQAAYKEELTEIEAAFLAERADLLAGNRAELEALLEKRSKAETDFLERYLASVESYQAQLEDVRNMDLEDYNILKAKLEMDIATLEQHLQNMRATYQLNTEKLEYNYRVLVERDHENQATVTQQKRKISRQRDLLVNLRQKYGDSEKRYAEENARLADEYRRITEQFKDLQAKFRRFQTTDQRKFVDVAAMNADEAVALAKKVLTADRLLHEQQLGWRWQAPDDAVFVAPAEEEAATPAPKAAENEVSAEVAEATRKAELQARLDDTRFWGALELLADEAGFLVDGKARAVIDRLPKSDKGAVQVAAILEALGVVDGPSFDALMGALSDSGGAGGGGDAASASTTVDPNEAVSRLKAFMETHRPSARTGATPSVASTTVVRARVASAADREREFWERLASVVDDKVGRVWGALEKQLARYHEVLVSRANGLREVESLAVQNSELKGLLNQYLSSRINTELKVPPTQII